MDHPTYERGRREAVTFRDGGRAAPSLMDRPGDHSGYRGSRREASGGHLAHAGVDLDEPVLSMEVMAAVDLEGSRTAQLADVEPYSDVDDFPAMAEVAEAVSIPRMEVRAQGENHRRADGVRSPSMPGERAGAPVPAGDVWSLAPSSLADHPMLQGLMLELPPRGRPPESEWLDRWFEAARAILGLLYTRTDVT